MEHKNGKWGSVYHEGRYCCTKTRSKYWILTAFQDLGHNKPTAEQAESVSQFVCGLGCLGDLVDWMGEIYVFRDPSTHVWQSPKERRTIGGHLSIHGSSRLYHWWRTKCVFTVRKALGVLSLEKTRKTLKSKQCWMVVCNPWVFPRYTKVVRCVLSKGLYWQLCCSYNRRGSLRWCKVRFWKYRSIGVNSFRFTEECKLQINIISVLSILVGALTSRQNIAVFQKFVQSFWKQWAWWRSLLLPHQTTRKQSWWRYAWRKKCVPS